MNNHYSEQFIQARSAMRCLYLELPESVARDAEALVVAALVAADERNRELTARLEAAVKLVRKCRDEMGGLPHSLGYAFTHLPEIDAWLATPAQPAAGELPDVMRPDEYLLYLQNVDEKP